jgi:hypothetical protein
LPLDTRSILLSLSFLLPVYAPSVLAIGGVSLLAWMASHDSSVYDDHRSVTCGTLGTIRNRESFTRIGRFPSSWV